MVRVTRVTGIVLIVLGLVYFVMTGSAHPTPLIPTLWGLLLLMCGVLAISTETKRIMLWMHIAVVLGLLGFLFPGIRAAMSYAKPALTVVQQTAAQEEVIMSAVCLIFTVLCVRNFIANRRERLA